MSRVSKLQNQRTTKTHWSGCDKLHTSTNCHICLRDILFTKHQQLRSYSGSNSPEPDVYWFLNCLSSLRNKRKLMFKGKVRGFAIETTCVTFDNGITIFNGSWATRRWENETACRYSICNYRVYLGKRALGVFFRKMIDMNETLTPTGLSVCDRPACSWLTVMSFSFHSSTMTVPQAQLSCKGS